MKSLKTDAIELIARLPEEVDIDDIMYHLSVLEKVRRGREDIEKGETISCDELDEEVKGW